MPLSPAIFAKEAALTVIFAYTCVQAGKGLFLLGKEIKDAVKSNPPQVIS